MEFFKEPWAPLLVCAVIASLLWTFMWLAMWSQDRFKLSIGGGFPVLFGGYMFTVPLGPLFLLFFFLGSIALTVFWVGASLTNTCEKERRAIAILLNPKAFVGKEEESPDVSTKSTGRTKK